MGGSAIHRLIHAPGGASSAAARVVPSAHSPAMRSAPAISRRALTERAENMPGSLTDRRSTVNFRAHRLRCNRVIFLRGRAGIPRRGP